MTRKQSPLTTKFPLHIVARSNNQDWFQAPLEECWQVFLHAIQEAHKRHGFRTHAFVMMSNHYHWLLSNPDFKLAEGMCHFQTTTSRGIARSVNRINRIYGARYKPTIVGSPAHFANVLRYIYQNPLRARICTRTEDYPWSSLNCKTLPLFPCEAMSDLVPVADFSDWLNSLAAPETNALIQKGLRRTVFKMPRDLKKRRFTGSDSL